MRTYVWDLLALLGLLLLTGGAGWVYRPLWLLVPGAALLGFGVWAASRDGRGKR